MRRTSSRVSALFRRRASDLAGGVPKADGPNNDDKNRDRTISDGSAPDDSEGAKRKAYLRNAPAPAPEASVTMESTDTAAAPPDQMSP